MSGSVFSSTESNLYRYWVTNLLISIKADIIHRPIIKQLLDDYKINYEVNIINYVVCLHA